MVVYRYLVNIKKLQASLMSIPHILSNIYINQIKLPPEFPATFSETFLTKFIKAHKASRWAQRAHLMELKDAALRRS